jgi:signal transduction histidine kinase
MDTFPYAAELLLATRSPMVIASGPELRTVHNEAYALLMRDARRAPADGVPLRELSPELWERAGPLIMQAMLGGQGAVLPDQLFCISRNGYADETYLTICCDPVLDEGGSAVGVMISLAETTDHVVGARRTATLRDVAAVGAVARSVDDACRRALEAVSRHPSDLPFALIYVVDADRRAARLVATAGLSSGASASPLVIHLGAEWEEASWPLAVALETSGTVVVDDLLTRFGSLPAGDWPFAPRSAVVAALTSPGRDQPDGVLVAGVSARHPLDESYLSFIELLTKHVAAAIAGGRLHEDEERNAAARVAAASAAAKRRARVRAMKERFAGVLEERTRLAREIHDTLLQGVTGISLNLQAVLPQVRTSPAVALETLERITELAVRTSREARLAVWDIRPQALKERELMRAVESAARLALGESSLALRVRTTGRARRLRADVQGVLLRVVQEAVANVARHAAARTVRITLMFRGPRLRVTVADDGRGFVVKRDFRSYTGHWGLVGMQERANQVGGSLAIRSARGRGTVVTLDVPIAISRKRGRAA